MSVRVRYEKQNESARLRSHSHSVYVVPPAPESLKVVCLTARINGGLRIRIVQPLLI